MFDLTDTWREYALWDGGEYTSKGSTHQNTGWFFFSFISDRISTIKQPKKQEAQVRISKATCHGGETFFCYSITKQNAFQNIKKPIQSTRNKSKSQAVEVRLSSDRISAKEKEGSSETCNTNIDPRDKISKADKYSKVQHADSISQEVIALAEIEKETKSRPFEIQNTFFRSSSVQEVEQVRTTPTKVQEVKSPKIKEMGIPVGATKRVKSPVKVQNGAIEVSKVESTPQADAQRDIKPFFRNTQEVRSTLINSQEQGNSTPVKPTGKDL